MFEPIIYTSNVHDIYIRTYQVRVEPSSAHAQYALGTFLGENRQNQEFQAWPFLLRATKLDKFKPDHFFNLAIVSSRIATTLRSNPKLKVHGVDSLRVIDASIMPFIVNCNLNATCIMIGEKGADLVKTDN